MIYITQPKECILIDITGLYVFRLVTCTATLSSQILKSRRGVVYFVFRLFMLDILQVLEIDATFFLIDI